MFARCWCFKILFIVLVSVFNPVISDPQINLLNFGCSQYNATNLSNFFSNLNATFNDLRANLSNANAYFATAQEARSSDPVYGMAQCREYMTTADCLACFDVAVTRIRNCSAANGARVIFDGCFLRLVFFFRRPVINFTFVNSLTFTASCYNQKPKG